MLLHIFLSSSSLFFSRPMVKATDIVSFVGGNRKARTSTASIQQSFRRPLGVSAGSTTAKNLRLRIWVGCLGRGGCRPVPGQRGNNPVNSLRRNPSTDSTRLTLKVVGVDISPHMKPDETPENLWLQVRDQTGFMCAGSILRAGISDTHINLRGPEKTLAVPSSGPSSGMSSRLSVLLT